ncbi:hypothetical protein MVEG_05240 [Podila verticillata NRRL 6337]|nr:MAG: hypothetical protein BYD32DRAFT_460421 [Podila humilis]KFH68425.1 hypothetical protein MVEG_05240 [Podila verticillata NRRL 6337]
MDSATLESPNDISIGTNSKALFIAEVLAGCAAVVMGIAIVCCFCSSAARRRSMYGDSTRSQFLLQTDQEMLEGRQTPEVAPAYTTSSPVGPLSPEVVDAISRASVECRHSLVISILSSSSSFHQQHQRNDSDSIDTQIRSGASSIIGQQYDSDMHPGRTSVERPEYTITISPAGSVIGDSFSETISRGELNTTNQARPLMSLSDLAMLPSLPPPLYDPTWRTTSLNGAPYSRRRHLRPVNSISESQGHGRNRLSLSAIPDRRTEATRQQHIQRHQNSSPPPTRSPLSRDMMRDINWTSSPSRRSISWTGTMIRLGGVTGLSHSRSSSRTSSNAASHRPNLQPPRFASSTTTSANSSNSTQDPSTSITLSEEAPGSEGSGPRSVSALIDSSVGSSTNPSQPSIERISTSTEP